MIRTQKDKKLQTLIEVCTDFASLSNMTSVHRPAEQVFALEEEVDQEEEIFAVVDRQQWNTQRAAEPPLSPELQQMFALARRMGYEMRPIARRFDAPRQTPGSRQSPNRDYRAPFRPRDYSRTKCFSCGQLGHTQVRCPKPDSSLPFRPSGWVDRSDGPQRNSGASPPLSPELQQMFALARRMGYEMRPIARRFDAPRQTPGSRQSPNRDYRAPFRPRDYSRTKCFSCGQLGHTQVRCPKPDSSLPFWPSGWVDRSDGPQRNSGASPQGNEI